MPEATPTARDLARRSQAAVTAKDRDAWLSLFASDAVVQDPVGPSPLDPQGAGHQGRAAIAAFYDDVIAPSERITFEIERSYLCGDEVADVGVIRTTLAGGRHVAVVRGVYTYRSNGEGKLAALRAFWELDAVEVSAPSEDRGELPAPPNCCAVPNSPDAPSATSTGTAASTTLTSGMGCGLGRRRPRGRQARGRRGHRPGTGRRGWRCPRGRHPGRGRGARGGAARAMARARRRGEFAAEQLAEQQVAALLVAADLARDADPRSSYRIGIRPTEFGVGDPDTGVELPLDDGLVWAALHQDAIVAQRPDRAGPLAGEPVAALLRRGPAA